MEVIGNEAEVDRSSAKVAAVAIAGLLLASGFSYFLNQLIASGGNQNLAFTLVFAVCFLAVYTLQPVLIKSPGKNYGIVLMESLALTVFFYRVPPMFLSAGFITLLVFLGWGAQSEQKEIKERLKLRIAKIVQVGFKSGITALSLFIVIIFLGGVRAEGTLLSKAAFERFIAPTAPLLQIIYPGVSLSDTFADGARLILESQLAETPEAALLSEAERNAFIAQGVQALRAEFVEFLGVNFGAGEAIVDILYKWFIATFSAFSPALQNTILAVIGALLFFALRSTSFLLAAPIEFLAFLIFRALIFIGFAARFTEPRTREFVVLK